MGNTKIQWATDVWNPITGCTPISDGCKNCYAKRMATRLRGRFVYPADEPFRVTFHPDRLEQPFHWKKPRRIFVCSMGDLFHEDVRADDIGEIFRVMSFAKQHTFILLTKRPKWAKHYYSIIFPEIAEYPNVWLGVSVSTQKDADRLIPVLLQIPAALIFISYEPALSSLCLRPKWLEKLGLLIAGCESGPKRRTAKIEWFRSVKDQCVEAGVPFFLKQMGNGFIKPETLKYSRKVLKMPTLDGQVWDQMPKM